MLEDEIKIIERAKDGEAEAFGLLYDHYLPKIYRFVLLKVSHREEAEDLTHQTFLKAWENISNYIDQGFPFSSWLYQISRNTVIDHYRSSAKAKSNENIDDLAEIISDENESIDSSLDKKMALKTVTKAIKELKDIEQDVIIMRFVDELSHDEVAKALDKTEGAVKLIQHRAIKNLKKILK